jgi:hypothetical protein
MALLLTPGTRKRVPQSGFVQTPLCPRMQQFPVGQQLGNKLAVLSKIAFVLQACFI